MEKYKINANRDQLYSIGIDYDIRGLVGILTHKFPTGWYELEVTHTYEAGTFTNKFDIPATFLEKIN